MPSELIKIGLIPDAEPLGSSAVVFPLEKLTVLPITSLPNNEFIVAKILLGLSSVFVNVPLPTIKLFPFPLSSFKELSSKHVKITL